jgi:hypothetical protein
MGGTCSMHGKDEKCIQHLAKNPEGKRPQGCESADWMHLAQDNRDQWWALVNTVMNLRVP